MDSNKGDNQLLDELLGIDPSAFEDDEHTNVYPRSDPPSPDLRGQSGSQAENASHPQEDEAPTGVPAAVAPRVAPRPPRPARSQAAPRSNSPVSAIPVATAPAVSPFSSVEAQPAASPIPAEAELLPITELSLPPPTVAAFAAVAGPSVEEPDAPVTFVPDTPSRAAAALTEELPDESAHAELVADAAPLAASVPAVDVAGASRDANDPLIGQLIDGRYRVLRILGVGGIGLVYLCQHEVLEKPVAIKLLRSEYVAHDDLNERFLNEARASSAIKSPRIVDTLDVGTMPDGAPYFVMEYVEGETLASMLDREGAIDLVRAIDMAKQMAEGLDAAHAAGVIHRDLKPENVFLAPQPDGALFVKIFDFGIAKVARARKRLTYAGAVFGTPHYMSPEQARGDDVDQRSDLYALGVMLFEMLTGKVPFDGEDPLAVMSQHVDRVPPLMSSIRGVSVPPVLEAIVSRCLAKDARDRYLSANELLADLESVPLSELSAVQPMRIAPAPVSVPARLPSLQQPRAETLHAHVVPTHAPPGKRNRLMWGGLTVAGAVAAAVVVWATQRDPATQGTRVTPPAQKAAATSPGSPGKAVTGGRSETVAPSKREVHFVLSPIDSHVFKGDEDLGPMPVSIEVQDGTPLTLSVRRKGYTTRRVVVDGSETRVVVGLMREAQPAPVSKAQALAKKKLK
jgi:serine/threonine-protein kinase